MTATPLLDRLAKAAPPKPPVKDEPAWLRRRREKYERDGRLVADKVLVP